MDRKEENVTEVSREVQRIKQEHEAALEEQKQELLRCQYEIQSLRESAVELQKSIARLLPPPSMSLSAASSPWSCSKTASIQSNPSHTSDTVQHHRKRRRITRETARFEDAVCAPELPVKTPETVASDRSKVRPSVGAEPEELMSRQVYVYTALPDCNSIRLLELASGSVFGPLQCKLIVSRSVVTSPTRHCRMLGVRLRKPII